MIVARVIEKCLQASWASGVTKCIPHHEILWGVAVLVFDVFVNYGRDTHQVVKNCASSGIIRNSVRIAFGYALVRWMRYQLICIGHRRFQ
jgi:hypothetical protein